MLWVWCIYTCQSRTRWWGMQPDWYHHKKWSLSLNYRRGQMTLTEIALVKTVDWQIWRLMYQRAPRFPLFPSFLLHAWIVVFLQKQALHWHYNISNRRRFALQPPIEYDMKHGGYVVGHAARSDVAPCQSYSWSHNLIDLYRLRDNSRCIWNVTR